MNPEQLALIQAELLNDPTQQGYGPHIPDGPGHLVELLNAQTTTMVKERFITARTMLAVLDPIAAATALEGLEQAASVNPVVKWGMKFLMSDPGLDVGHVNTRMLLDALVQQGVLASESVDTIKALAQLPASRAEVVLQRAGAAVTEADVRAALEV